MSESSADFDPTAIEEVFRIADRPLWLVTAAVGPRRGGLVATFVQPASIDAQDPRVVVGLAPNHFTAELILAAGAFGLHLIGAGHLDLAWRFALHSGRDVDKLAGCAWRTGASGAPLLAECLAWLDCQVADRWDIGDRIFFLAEVLAGQRCTAGTPITEADLIRLATPDQKGALRAVHDADLDVLRPLREAWSRKRSPSLP